MTAIRAKFDGQQIEVPPELRQANPAEVVILFDDNPQPKGSHSIWDVFGKAEVQRTAEEIDKQIREERDSWVER